MSRKKCFAIVAELKNKKGLDDVTFWDMIKNHLEITSRKEMTEDQWEGLARRLVRAQRSKDVFDKMMDAVESFRQTEQPECKFTDAEGNEYRVETITIDELLDQETEKLKDPEHVAEIARQLGPAYLAQIKADHQADLDPNIITIDEYEVIEEEEEEEVEVDDETIFRNEGMVVDFNFDDYYKWIPAIKREFDREVEEIEALRGYGRLVGYHENGEPYYEIPLDEEEIERRLKHAEAKAIAYNDSEYKRTRRF